MSILCRIGLHKWSRWYQGSLNLFQHRQCKRCGFMQEEEV